MKPIVRPASLGEIVWISSRLRSEDAREVLTASGRKAEDVLPETAGKETYTVRFEHDGDPVMIFGVGPDIAKLGWGIIWLLATDDVNMGAKGIAAEVPHWLNHWLRFYPAGLHNLVDTRNETHLRWLHRMDFTMGQTVEIRGVPFQHFYLRGEDV